MSRSMILSNGELAVALDSVGQVRDIYYPHVGQEDHVRGHYLHRVGVWVEGVMSWISDPDWSVVVTCENNALASSIIARNNNLQIELLFTDIIYNEQPVFVRRVRVTNGADRIREIKLYFGQQFEIYKAHGGDTAFFDPESHSIVHYKDKRAFLMSGNLDGEQFQDYATGRAGYNNQEGTHRDCDDGMLSQNAIEHGPADSVIGFYGQYAVGQSRVCHYWLLAAHSIHEARALDHSVRQKTASHIVLSTREYWRAWIKTYTTDLSKLSSVQSQLYTKSLMYVRAHLDGQGGIIASLDSDMLQWGYDTYAYVWPRDAAYAATMLDIVGDTSAAKRFFKFCARVISADGYFLHKFWADGSFGSSWHPWIKDGHPQLPIQEDETAIVVVALYNHFQQSRDLEFLEAMFDVLVKKPAEFMIHYRDGRTHLPFPSYDLWERKRGTSTYTSASVYGALVAASEMAKILGKSDLEVQYLTVAHEIRAAILEHLWDEEKGVFINMITHTGEKMEYDRTVDISSVYGLMKFEVLDVHDDRMIRAWNTSIKILTKNILAGGVARFENDEYFRIDSTAPGNPWVLTTLWYAEYIIRSAENIADMKKATDIFDWVVLHAQPSGVLSEQLNPYTGEQVGATPLAWTHAAYVLTVQAYLECMLHLKK
ncbi:MAG: glycoside hydrolase 15-related protein [Candidatus Kaiserbacteria bacterium]|nr:glycoside hydrolase 15-related protein [Candidatus Kaiserbacteria bacterium]